MFLNMFLSLVSTSCAINHIIFDDFAFDPIEEKDVCEGLRVLHKNGYIHRDIKTDNIFVEIVNKEDRFVLGDFGLTTTLNAGINCKDHILTKLKYNDCRELKSEVFNVLYDRIIMFY